MRIDLHLQIPKKPVLAAGSGFIALDVIESEHGDHHAAGGTCGNVLSVLAWLGWYSIPIARIGKDSPGKFVLEELREAGVDTSCIRQDASTPTPVVIQRAVVDSSGKRTHRFALTCPECGQWLPRFRSIVRGDAEHAKQLIRNAPAVYFFDRVSPGINALARWARDAGSLVMFEPSNYSDERHFREAIELSHILKFSKERLGHVRDFRNTPYPAIVIETLGEEGLRIRWHGRWSEFDAFTPPRFVDAAGAGDWCSAGFLHVAGQGGAAGLKACTKPTIERAIQVGQALSALNCAYVGARGLMEVLTMQAASKLLRPLAGGEGKLPDEGDAESKPHRKVAVCELCKPASSSNGRQRRRHSG
jgi:fructokinase